MQGSQTRSLNALEHNTDQAFLYSSRHPPANGTAPLSSRVIWGSKASHWHISLPLPSCAPKISLLFLFLSVSKLTVHRWLSLPLNALKTHLPRDFCCLSRNPPVDGPAPLCFPVIRCSITSHWHLIYPQPSSAQRTLLSVFSCPSENWLCTQWSMSLKALTTKHPHGSLMYTKKCNSIWGCSTRFASYRRLYKFLLTSTPSHCLPMPQDMSLFSSLVFIKTGCAEVTFHATAGHSTKITHVFVMYFKVICKQMVKYH